VGVRRFWRKILSSKHTQKCGLEDLFYQVAGSLASKNGALVSFLFLAYCTLYQMKIALQTLDILEKE
jgi:hypothetical protein